MRVDRLLVFVILHITEAIVEADGIFIGLYDWVDILSVLVDTLLIWSISLIAGSERVLVEDTLSISDLLNTLC